MDKRTSGDPSRLAITPRLEPVLPEAGPLAFCGRVAWRTLHTPVPGCSKRRANRQLPAQQPIDGRPPSKFYSFAVGSQAPFRKPRTGRDLSDGDARARVG